MTQPFLQTTDDLRHTVKVNVSFKFEILGPYLQDAFDRCIVPHLGEALVDRLYREPLTGDILTIKTLASRTLGPLAVAITGPELRVLTDDSGHTVGRSDKFTVASDQKIARSEESMQERGWNNLDKLLEHLGSHENDYPERKESRYYKNQADDHYLNSAREFQDYGKVNIDYSRLTLEKFRPLLDIPEMKLCRWIGTTLDKSLKDTLRTGVDDPPRIKLIDYIRIWFTMYVVKLHTGQTTWVQHAAANQLEFKPVIYSLYSDPTDNGNFYAEQVTPLEAVIEDYMKVYASKLGLPAPIKNDFNSEDKHIFVLREK